MSYMHNLKKATRTVHNTKYKHSYDPKDFRRTPEVTSLIGPVYGVSNAHTYGHDYKAELDEKNLSGPVYMDGRHSYGHTATKPAPPKPAHSNRLDQKDSRHSYGKDFSRPTPDKPSAGPVMNADHKHSFKHQMDLPHMRDVKKGGGPVYETTQSHHYSESKTHKSDNRSLQGPIYTQSAPHSFTDGYSAPKARSASKDREDQQKELVGKFFNKAEKRKETTKAAKAKFEQMASDSTSTSRGFQSSSSQFQMESSSSSSFAAASSTQVSQTEKKSVKSIEQAQQAGEQRKQEAKQRREEFVMKKLRLQFQAVSKLLSNFIKKEKSSFRKPP
jgi:hypothetical protein